MRTNTKANSILLFLIGTFSMTQIRVIGSIGISELAVFLVAPFVFLQDMNTLKKDGFMTILVLSLLTCVSCVASSLYNGTPFALAIRGFASPYSIFALVVVFHRLLRKDMNGLKWVLMGWALSQVINIFVFQRAVEIHNYGDAGADQVEGIMSSPIFWIGRLGPWISLPITGWYLQTPTFYSLIEPLAFSGYALFSTASGRAGALCCLGSFLMLLIGRKSDNTMRLISKKFGLFVVAGIVILGVFKFVYQYAAESGALNEKALEKYERQTNGKKGFLAIIMGGRSEFFIGLMAALQRPVIGYGPWPQDHDGIVGEFLVKYGNQEDYARRQRYLAWAASRGLDVSQSIPTHSHIISGWVWYGVVGLILWCYVFARIISFLRKDIANVPGWFGYFAVMIPQLTWDILFSPFGGRINIALLITCLLISAAVRRQRIAVPQELMALK